MSRRKKNSKDERGLSRRADPNGLTLDGALTHPVVQRMSEKLEEMRQLVEGLPEAIGRAVAQATRKPPVGASGPPVPLVGFGKAVEFHKGGKIVEDGQEVKPKKP